MNLLTAKDVQTILDSWMTPLPTIHTDSLADHLSFNLSLLIQERTNKQLGEIHALRAAVGKLLKTASWMQARKEWIEEDAAAVKELQQVYEHPSTPENARYKTDVTLSDPAWGGPAKEVS